ncbi:MAG: hypothetical protein IKU19_00285, partial [Clostridia bacterium]|nr:hypothetical protein [Clostridia bacterium]
SFLREFNEIWTLYIYNGHNIKDLSFMRGNKAWFQLYIEDASFKDFEDIFPGGEKQGLHSYCLGLVNCNVEDKSLLLKEDFWLSELYVLFPEGTDTPDNPNRRENWITHKKRGYFYGEYRIKK